MPNLNLVVVPAPSLKKRSRIVLATEYASLRTLGQDMLKFMEKNRGVGLAAPQIGQNIQMFVASRTGLAKDGKVYINPMFMELAGAEIADEGCLSIPEIALPIRRHSYAMISAIGSDGCLFYEDASGFLARIWQHEMDHLHGVLIIDRYKQQNPIVNNDTL